MAEANYGRTAEALWYMDRIVETFNRVTPGSISEMMPDFGCFTIAWTSYGIVVPLIQHVFGIEPDAVRKTVVFAPHMPEGWDELSIEDLPVGTNLVSFAGARTAKGMEYTFESRDSGWTFVLQTEDSPGARYLPERPTVVSAVCRHSDDRSQEPGAGESKLRPLVTGRLRGIAHAERATRRPLPGSQTSCPHSSTFAEHPHRPIPGSASDNALLISDLGSAQV